MKKSELKREKKCVEKKGRKKRRGNRGGLGDFVLVVSLRSSEKVLQMNDLSRDICTADSVVVGL